MEAVLLPSEKFREFCRTRLVVGVGIKDDAALALSREFGFGLKDGFRIVVIGPEGRLLANAGNRNVISGYKNSETWEKFPPKLMKALDEYAGRKETLEDLRKRISKEGLTGELEERLLLLCRESRRYQQHEELCNHLLDEKNGGS